MKENSVLIIGSGVSGLFFALKAAQKRPDVSFVIVTKSKADNSNTHYAQGGIAVVMDKLKDSFEQHINDTLKAGGGACKPEVVKMVVEQAPDRLQELLDFEVNFDKNSRGDFNLGLEGGHSQHRILHHKDSSGMEIQDKLLARLKKFPNIQLLENTFVTELLLDEKNKSCTGVCYYDENTKTSQDIFAQALVLSTGGCGQVFKNTTNPAVATGDGVAMAARIGAKIEDMQYIQFHPTALYEKEKNPNFLISEAVRGFGAHIVNHEGKRFVFEYDPRGELATRDVVSKAIGSELKKSGKECVYIDCRHLEQTAFQAHFPTIYTYCKNAGFDLSRELAPIVPVAHYQCGGIAVNKQAETSVPGLYAIGECACTGLHGKNRLASNSLLEALVYAHQCAEKLCSQKFEPTANSIQEKKECQLLENQKLEELKLLKAELNALMTSVFINEINTQTITTQFNDLLLQLNDFREKSSPSIALKELENCFEVARLIVKDRF